MSQPQMRDAVAAHDYGKVVRLARRARGLTQQEPGGRAGCSAATISRMETGHQALDDMTTLRILARVLDIPPSWLGLSSPPVLVEPHLAGEDDAVKRRRFLAGLTGAALLAGPQEAADAATMAQRLERFLTTDAAGTPATMTELRAVLDVARTTFDACRYDDLSIMLPRVAATAQATLAQVEGRERDQVNACLADAYVLTSELAVKFNQDGMAWVAADRALATATVSGEPFAVAGASRAVAIAMRRQGRLRERSACSRVPRSIWGRTALLPSRRCFGSMPLCCAPPPTRVPRTV
ncbi:helix-turn-helix domain-containing protein [Streptosporangium sp. OZ121]|uniref:helix-turn-helix domain-containing protein n=1 Tax=Streptosporangium sp. OZ121 TaxID=3444183 RepID=UPI003F799066